ncbi:MAG: RagB/SusD family nutrient uptake outer membrane protein [Aestuariibaculum sp.]
MKARIKIYMGLLVMLVIGVSCSDNFLEDMKAYGKYDDTFYQSEERVTWYVDNIYYDFFSGYTNPLNSIVGYYTQDYTRFTEEIGGVLSLTNPNYTYTNPDDVGYAGYYGTKLENKINNHPYNRIRDINAFLEEIDVKGANLGESFREEMKGQMYYLRALQYFDLMKIYGGVPLVTTVQTASSTDESIKLPRATVGEVVNQIVADFDMAASLLPNNWDSSNYGRFTKGAALAQKARVLLTYASPLFNPDWESTERWATALAAGLEAEAQLSGDGYGLYGSSATDWADMFLIDNAFCPEAITVQFLGSGNSSSISNSTWEKGIRLSNQTGGGGLSAPKEMIDLFPMADGSEPTVANGYDDFLFFLNRDPRFYRTFSFSGRKWGYSEDADATVWAYRWSGVDSNDGVERIYYSDGNQVSSPAFVCKMSNPSETSDNSFGNSGTDIFEYRYAELLLNIAEAYAGTGDVPNALAYIGRVRNRVNIPSANNYGIGSLADKYAAFKACLYERQIELAYEGKRFWDIQRWMLYDDDASIAANNTCAALGVTPINGTKRTGHYLQYISTVTEEDPLAVVREGISIDPDDSDFETNLAALATIYSSNFELVDLEDPMDNDGGNEVTIDFKPNYYIMGLKTNVLSQNTWLEQTIGWESGSGSAGAFNYQE